MEVVKIGQTNSVNCARLNMMIGSVMDGRYLLLGLLGTGGMGSVYEAEHTGTGRKVAVKVIDRGLLATSHVALDRFDREARIAGAIETQHIAQVLDVGTDAKTGIPYIAMEFLRGTDLRQLIDNVGPIEPLVALRIVAQACIGLQKAHDAQVIHRDIKPANIFLAQKDDDECVVKLLDFGIAKIMADPSSDLHQDLTKTGSLLGTPNYMSPEQFRGVKVIDRRSDLWSLGMVLYQLLTGRTPFQDIEAFGELMIAICCEPLPPVEQFAPWVSPEVTHIVTRALQRSVDERFQSAQEMLNAIRALLPSGLTITNRDLVPLAEKAKRSAVSAAPAPTDPLANTWATSVDQPSAPVLIKTNQPSPITDHRAPVREDRTATMHGTLESTLHSLKTDEQTRQTPLSTTSEHVGRIERVGTGEAFLLRSHLLFGRSAACDVRIQESRVSGEHARLRWTGSTWEIRDLGSKNGTFVAGKRLAAGEGATLLAGDTIGLGGASAPAPMFVVTNASAPVLSARSTRSNVLHFASHGMLTLPNDEYPAITVVEGREGKWFVEEGDAVREAVDGEALTIDGETWVLDVPGVAVSTVAVESLVLSLETITLRFSVSNNGQDVALTIVCPGKEIHLSPEKQHPLLLELARTRQSSTSAALEEQGWIDRGDLCRRLGMNDQRLQAEVHQVRKQFAALGIQGAANIVERRPGTNSLRLGVESVEVKSVAS